MRRATLAIALLLATSTAVGCSSEATSRSKVLLPQPLGPRMATNSPCAMDSDSSASASTPSLLPGSGKRLLTLSMAMAPFMGPRASRPAHALPDRELPARS